MTTYQVYAFKKDGETLYRGTSLNKAKKVCDACEEPCAVFHNVAKLYATMPVEYGNDRFKALEKSEIEMEKIKKEIDGYSNSIYCPWSKYDIVYSCRAAPNSYAYWNDYTALIAVRHKVIGITSPYNVTIFAVHRGIEGKHYLITVCYAKVDFCKREYEAYPNSCFNKFCTKLFFKRMFEEVEE